MYALVDANAFYCSAEQVFRPEWRGKPLIVLSNNDGCIVAANKQALALGIQKFQPYFKAQRLCKEKGIIVCSSNYELYADLSNKMMQIIGRFATTQHIYSIDESFLFFDDVNHNMSNNQAISNFIQIAQKIRKTVWKETRLPVCVGLGNTLTLAKLANHIAKRYANTQGVYLLPFQQGGLQTQQQEYQQLLTQLTPSDVWGIGSKTAKKLANKGIDNLSKLITAQPYQLKHEFNVELIRTVKELNGEKCKEWDHVRADKLQIYSTRSVGQRITDSSSLQQALSKHVAIAAAKARQQGSLCGTLIAFATNSPFDQQPCSFKIIKHFTPATNSTVALITAISENINLLYQANVQYYRVGIGLLNLSSQKHQQFELFNQHNNDLNLMKVVDTINQKYGTDTLLFASQGVNHKWAMRRHFLTPQYTTNWQDIPKIGC